MFEPCGLTQMIGMRYGAGGFWGMGVCLGMFQNLQTPSLPPSNPPLVPVVRRTGGLGDTVADVAAAPPGEGNGYVFDGTDEGR
jgi:starch synthase